MSDILSRLNVIIPAVARIAGLGQAVIVYQRVEGGCHCHILGHGVEAACVTVACLNVHSNHRAAHCKMMSHEKRHLLITMRVCLISTLIRLSEHEQPVLKPWMQREATAGLILVDAEFYYVLRGWQRSYFLVRSYFSAS